MSTNDHNEQAENLCKQVVAPGAGLRVTVESELQEAIREVYKHANELKRLLLESTAGKTIRSLVQWLAKRISGESAPAQGDVLSQPWIDFNDKVPEEGQYVVICGPMPPDIKSDCKGWRTCARYVAGSLLDGNGCTRNSATHWMPMADSYADRALTTTPAESA